MYIRGKWWDYSPGRVLPYGPDLTYALGMRWLSGLHVEDWGSGAGYAKNFLDPPLYTGIDGSPGPRTTIVADLTTYLSDTEGLFMRHVLEHNDEWDRILRNALHSFRKKMSLILFTPPAEKTHVHVRYEDGVPDIFFKIEDLENRVTEEGASVRSVRRCQTATQYGVETVILIRK